MKYKRIVGIILGLLIFGSLLTLLMVHFIFGLEEVPPIFVAFHFIAYLYMILFFVFFILVKELFWLFLPSSIKKMPANEKSRYSAIVLTCCMIFFIGTWIMNHYCFDYRINLVSTLGNVGIVILALSLASILLKPARGKYLIFYFSGFLLFISVLLSLVALNQQNHSKPSLGEALQTLPYIKWVPAEKTIEKQGVTVYNREKSSPGINFYKSQGSSPAYLINMSGDILHTWSGEIKENYTFGHIELCENCDLLSMARKRILVRMDWNSNIKWIKRVSAHHDIDIHEDNDIYTLTHDYEVIFRSGIPLPFGNNYISILSPEGEVKKTISLYKILENEIPLERFKAIARWLIDPEAFVTRIEKGLLPPRDVFAWPTDLFHSNTIEIINKDFNKIFKKGNVLCCIRNLDLIAVIDVDEEKLVWSWGKNNLEGPHHPTFLENGNILIFDNGYFRKYSRIIELNPLTKKIVWQYTADPPESFYSMGGGASQRLPNGNTLITESNKGRVFEITEEGETVWEFYNPEINRKRKKRASIYRMMRITDLEKYSCLKRLLY